MLLQIHEPGQTPLPHEGEQKRAVGIDLGTTNSVVAVIRDGEAQAFRDEDGSALVPSVVAYAPDGSAIVGSMAQQLALNFPDRVVSSVKRLMGRGVEDIKTVAGTLPYDVVPAHDGGMVKLRIGDLELSPVEISAEILRGLKDRAEEALGGEVKKAVITVPAYFDDAARTATRDAARLAGLEVLRLVNEPTAAALAYGLDEGAEGLYAVYDLGGGTFDVSLLRMQTGVFQVRSTGGDAALGGDDFDHAIAERIMRERGTENPSRAEVRTALTTARMIKEALSEQDSGTWYMEAEGLRSEHSLTRAEFDELIAPMVQLTLDTCLSVLEDAEVFPEDVKGVVLVGGSTRVPLVRRRVADLFGQEPLADINPDEVVAVGAARQADALTGGSDALLLDVAPLSLGIETMGGIVEKVIERNTTIPVSMAQEFTTYQDGQSAMMIHVVQGEREMVDQCRSLGRFVLSGIPPMTAGAARIRVTYSVDADGLLTVSAREETTGTEQKIEVKPSYGLGEEEMADMLRASMENARADMEWRLLAEARVEAERGLGALDAALRVDGDLLTDDEREALLSAAADVRTAVGGNDRDAINEAAERLDQASVAFAQKRMDRGIADALKGVAMDDLETRVGNAGNS